MASSVKPKAKENDSAAPEPKLRRPRDIIFILDSSGSISDEDFGRTLMFTSRIVSLLDISQTQTRVALINYGTKTKVEFSLHHHSTESEIQKAITQVSPLGGSTRTSDALEKAIKICEQRHNPCHPLITILITDGHSDSKNRATQMSTILRQQWGAHFFAIGVGSAVNQTELGSLASSKENVLLVDSYQALKNVREKVTVKACAAVPKPRLKKITSLGQKKKVMFIGEFSKEIENKIDVANKKMIEYIREMEEKPLQTEILYLTFKEDSKITTDDRAKAKGQNVTLVGSEFPMGCSEQPIPADVDVYAVAFYQRFLNSSSFSDVTHIIGHAPYTGNAMHNIAKALGEKNGNKPKTVLLVSGEMKDENTKKCLKLADSILCLDNTIDLMEFLGQNLEKISAFNINTKTETTEGKDEPDVKEPKDSPDAAAEQVKKEDPIHNPEMVFLKNIYDGIKVDVQLTTREDGSDSSNHNLQAALDVVNSLLETRNHLDSTNPKSHVSNQVAEAWVRFISEIEVPNRKILRLERPGNLSFRVVLFCPTEQSVRELWEQLLKEMPISTALEKALRASEVSYETCQIDIKHEVKEEVVGTVVLTSEEYVKLVTRIISRRKKEQDRNWTTVHGSAKDRKIAEEIEKRRLDRKWEEILDEARSLTGERGVQALEKAREQCDNYAELVAQIEASRQAGSFMDFMRDIISSMCRIM